MITLDSLSNGKLIKVNPPVLNFDDVTLSAVKFLNNISQIKLDAEKLENKMVSSGLTTLVYQIIKSIDGTLTQHNYRLLLSQSNICNALIYRAMDTIERTPSRDKEIGLEGDKEAIVNQVMVNVEDMRKELVDVITEKVLGSRNITDSVFISKVKTYARSTNLPLADKKTESAILSISEQIRKQGEIPALVDDYLIRETLDGPVITSSFKSSMVKYLLDLKLKSLVRDRFDNQEYDEYFALAYDHALKSSSASVDPIDNARVKGSISNWDFQVDTFETIEEQGTIPENILAAGALDYIYELGDRLGIFKITDAIILNWAGGILDIPQGATASKLYRYFKLRDERSSYDERAMLYKRVLNKGDGKTLSRMVVNTEFTTLWNKLMKEIASYIEKTEDVSGITERISKQSLYQATVDLQYNLTANMTGMAQMQVTEAYAHLKECMEILNDEEIISQLASGNRKNMWAVIEKVSKEEFKVAAPISALRTIAVEGNKIFRWIAEFNPNTVTEEKLRNFLPSGESYILAQSETGDVKISGDDEEEEIEDGEEESDDFEAFN